jgi:hypothetical protein
MDKQQTVWGERIRRGGGKKGEKKIKKRKGKK